MPSIDTLHRELEPQGFTALLVDIGEAPEVVGRVVRERGYAAPVVLDPAGEVAGLYGVRGTPTVFVVGASGLLLGRAIGPRPWAGPEGRALLRELLRARAAAGR